MYESWEWIGLFQKYILRSFFYNYDGFGFKSATCWLISWISFLVQFDMISLRFSTQTLNKTFLQKKKISKDFTINYIFTSICIQSEFIAIDEEKMRIVGGTLLLWTPTEVIKSYFEAIFLYWSQCEIIDKKMTTLLFFLTSYSYYWFDMYTFRVFRSYIFLHIFSCIFRYLNKYWSQWNLAQLIWNIRKTTENSVCITSQITSFSKLC